MIAWENQIFTALRLTGQLVGLFLHFKEHKLTDEVKHRILCENIFPHIVDVVFIREYRIALARVYAGSVTHVEWKEEGIAPRQLGCHIDFV